MSKAKRRKKGRARKGHAKGRLRKRYGRSGAPEGVIRMNVTGQLVLDPEKLESIIEDVVEAAVEEAVEESVPDTVAEAVEESVGDSMGDASFHYGD